MGLELLVHHNLADLRDGAARWTRLMSQTEPSLVAVCVDVELAARARLNPVSFLDQNINRLGGVHLRNTSGGAAMEVLGQGDVNLDAVSRLLRQSFFRGYLTVDLRPEVTAARTRSLPMALYESRIYMQRQFATRPGYRPVDMGPHVRLKGLDR
jgi:sugar phosphate isomerase/epimerase